MITASVIRPAHTVVADLHYSVGKGECKDTNMDPCDGDAETAKWLGDALDAERPDLVVSLVVRLGLASTNRVLTDVVGILR